MRAFVVVAFLLAAGAARAAEAPPATCFAHPERWAYDRDKETLAAPGERFFDDLRACDATFAAAVAEAIRYQIQADEAAKFVRSKDSVLLAYGVAWGILAVSGLLLWLRQRRLVGEIAALETRLKAAGEKLLTAAHFIYIPIMLMVGVVLGFFLGGRAARDQMALAQKKTERRAAARAARAGKVKESEGDAGPEGDG